MTDTTKKQLQDVQRLLAERRKFEQWLAQLDSRKGATPGHVFEKVRADYVARLSGAQERLAAETVAVRSLVTELESSLDAHERRITERTDEREEAELRHLVGEFREKDWEETRAKLDGAIAEQTRERDILLRELNGLRSLLSEASPAVEETPVTPAGVAKAEPAPAAEPEPAEASTAAAETAEPAVAFDELAFLKSVVGRTTPLTNPAGQGAASSAAGSQATHARRTPRGSGASGRGPSPGTSARPSSHEPVPEPVPSRESRDEPDLRTGGAAPRPSGSFGMPTPRSSEAVKSLKCQECGTLNFPTEWYCERCGGELAAF